LSRRLYLCCLIHSDSDRSVATRHAVAATAKPAHAPAASTNWPTTAMPTPMPVTTQVDIYVNASVA
jgi:hypothetical protein